MKKNSIKNTRINAEVHRELAQLIREGVKDARVSPMTSVVDVEVTPDLQFCKVYISTLGGGSTTDKTIEGLRAASGYLRRELAARVNLRHTPQLQFVADHSLEYGAHMDALIHQVSQEQAARGGETAAAELSAAEQNRTEEDDEA